MTKPKEISNTLFYYASRLLEDKPVREILDELEEDLEKWKEEYPEE